MTYPMTAMTREARRLRASDPYMSAKTAVELARYRATAPTLDDGDEWQADGYTLRVTVTPDDEPFEPGDVAPVFVKEPTPETIRNPRADGDSRRMGSDMPYAETPYNPRSDRIAFYRQAGASRSVAVELGERDIREELDRWTGAYGPTPYVVTVTASRAGVTLGRASLCGCDLGDDHGDAGRYVAEVVADLTPEALTEARAARAAICTS